MIGNSYTQGNSSAPPTYQDLQGFFDADPSIDGAVFNRSFGGATLRSHADPDGATVSLLQSQAGHYDVVVLQERSDRPGRAIKFGGSQLTGLDEGGPVLIKDYIRVYQPQARVVLFNTWARHPTLEPADDDDLAAWFNDNPVEMQLFTDAGYDRILTGSPVGDLSDVTDIAPVGDAWRAWYTAEGYADPAATLHDTDGSHQNTLGAYLSAAVLYETIAQRRVVGNSYLGGLAGLPEAAQLALRLQQKAAAAVGLVDLPGDYNANGVVEAADYTVWRDNVGGPPGALANDADGGVIAAPQYETWRANFGSRTGSTARSVPEFQAICIASLAIAILAAGPRMASS